MSKSRLHELQWQWPHFVSVGLLVLGFGLLGLWLLPEPEVAIPVQAQKELLPLVKVTDIPVLRDSYQPTGATASDSARQALKLGDEFVASLSARSLYVLDVTSATPLLSKNPERPEYPASTTKLMTALVARQNYELAMPITITNRDTSFGTIIGLQPGEVLTVRDLLAAVVIRSGNDAAVALANHYPGGSAAFVNVMNQVAKSIGLTHTTFSNADGLDVFEQQTTARDLSIIAREAALDPVLAELANTKNLTITDQSGIQHQLRNTNALLGVEPGVVGLKTGTTEQAGEVLITLVERDNRQVLIVLMGSQNRYDETRAILRWVFDHYQWLSFDQAQLKLQSHGTN